MLRVAVVMFQSFGKFKDELQLDPVVKSHFQSLYDGMLEKNLCRIIEPYSRVQIDHIAKTIGIPVVSIELELKKCEEGKLKREGGKLNWGRGRG